MYNKLNPIERVQLNIEERERDKIRQVRIQSMTEQYLEKLNLKNNVFSQQKRKEEIFNKKLSDLKQLKSFVNVQERLSRMNAFNNIDFILKVNKRKIENNFDNYLRQPLKKEKSLDELLDETKEFSKSYIQFIQGYSQKKQQNSESGQEISQDNPKRKYSDNTNVLSRKFSTKIDTEDSPPKFNSETKRKIRIQKPKAFLPKDFNIYYEQFKEQSEMIISQAKMEAKMRYLKESDLPLQKVRRSQSQKLLSVSPSQNKNTKTQYTNKSPEQKQSKFVVKSSKSKILNDLHINDDIIQQLNLLKQTCSQEVDESEKIVNKKLMRRMSSAFDLINEKYQGQKK